MLKEDAISVKRIFLKAAASIVNILAGIDPKNTELFDRLQNFYTRLLELRLRKVIQVLFFYIFNVKSSCMFDEFET